MKVMDQASGALDEVERRTDRLNAKLDAMLAEGEEAAKRLAELKAKGAAEGKDSSEDKKEDNEDASATIEETEAGKGPDDDKEAV